MVVVTQAVVAVVNVGVAMGTEGVVFVKNNTCVADLGGDNGLFVKVERMNVNKMDMKKVSSLPSQSVETVQESDLVTNGETVCAKKTRTLTI
jgi:hypothetical protein